MQVFKRILSLSICSLSLVFGGKNTQEALVQPLALPEILYSSTSLKIGTLGLGLELSIPLYKQMKLRASLNGLRLNTSIDKEQITYKGDLDLLVGGILLDYYPSESSDFYLSLGAYYSNNQAKGTASPSNNNYEVGDNVYTQAQLGTLDASLHFQDFAPYLGFGYASMKEKGWGFSMDMGLMYHGKSSVNLSLKNSSLLGADLAKLQSDIDKEKQNIQNDLDSFPFYPVLMLGLSYKF